MLASERRRRFYLLDGDAPRCALHHRAGCCCCCPINDVLLRDQVLNFAVDAEQRDEREELRTYAGQTEVELEPDTRVASANFVVSRNDN